jgi:nucleoside-diphosphate kinase
MRFLTGEPLEYTFALIKPDAVMKGYAGAILAFMEQNFLVADVFCSRWTRAEVSLFYSEHANKPYFDELVSFMSGERMYAVTLVSPNAVERWRTMMGATDSRKAAPNTIRGLYGAKTDVIMHNAVHGSDSARNAEREMHIVRTRVSCGWTFGNEAQRLKEKFTGYAWDETQFSSEP